MITPLIYASADQEYYDQHAEAFVNSAEKYGMNVKIDLIDDRYEALKEKLNPTEPRVFYCFMRFLLLPELIDQYKNILVIDVDSIFNSRVQIDEKYDLGLFFRPWIKDNDKKILCGASYFTERSKSFAERVREKLLVGKSSWSDDQLAFWETYQEMGERFTILNMDQKFLNYEFDYDAPIWTAKGIYRKKNPVYLSRKKAHEHAYQ